MSKITMEFARQDDCLDKMVPSDLRLLVGERDALSAQVEVLRRSILKAYNHQLNVGYDNQRGVSEVFSLLGDAFLLAQATPAACLAQVQLWEQVQGKPSYTELAAQVEVLRKVYRNLCGAINDADDTETGSDEHDEAIGKIFSVMRDGYLAANQSPAACLAQVRADAGRAGFIAGAHALETIQILASDESIFELADDYAERIRQGGAS
jgi:hypothetical protein